MRDQLVERNSPAFVEPHFFVLFSRRLVPVERRGRVAGPRGDGFREWLRSLGREIRRTIGADVYRVQCAWPTGKPLVDGFGGGLYEVRTTANGNQYRVFFYIEANAVVLVHGTTATMVLIHGIHKKTQKTPQADVALARRRMKERT